MNNIYIIAKSHEDNADEDIVFVTVIEADAYEYLSAWETRAMPVRAIFSLYKLDVSAEYPDGVFYSEWPIKVVNVPGYDDVATVTAPSSGPRKTFITLSRPVLTLAQAFDMSTSAYVGKYGDDTGLDPPELVAYATSSVLPLQLKPTVAIRDDVHEYIRSFIVHIPDSEVVLWNATHAFTKRAFLSFYWQRRSDAEWNTSIYVEPQLSFFIPRHVEHYKNLSMEIPDEVSPWIDNEFAGELRAGELPIIWPFLRNVAAWLSNKNRTRFVAPVTIFEPSDGHLNALVLWKSKVGTDVFAILYEPLGSINTNHGLLYILTRVLRAVRIQMVQVDYEGTQTFEHKYTSQYQSETERGYCAAWCLFFVNLVMQFPDISPAVLLQHIWISLANPLEALDAIRYYAKQIWESNK